MIELTAQQIQAFETSGVPLRLVNPLTRETFVLLREEEYARLKAGDYDDGPWTDTEMDLLAEEAGELLDRYEP